MACSRLAWAAMVSRSDSVHTTNASREAICRASAAPPPNNRGHSNTRPASPTAATGHRVTASTATPTTAAARIRADNAGERSAASARAARDGGRVGSTWVPRRPATTNSRPTPRPAPNSTVSATVPVTPAPPPAPTAPAGR